MANLKDCRRCGVTLPRGITANHCTPCASIVAAYPPVTHRRTYTPRKKAKSISVVRGGLPS